MEKYLGRKLTKKERIHHINHIKTDNRIENLELCRNNGEHMRKHHPDIWKRRKINPEYTANQVKKILKKISNKSDPKSTCFCGGKYLARNLCSKHYGWAYKHNFRHGF